MSLSDLVSAEVIGLRCSNRRSQPGAQLEEGKCLRAEPVRLNLAEPFGYGPDHQLMEGDRRGRRSRRGDASGDQNVVLITTTRLERRRIRVVALVDRELQTAATLPDLPDHDFDIPGHDQELRLVNRVSRGSETQVGKARSGAELSGDRRIKEAGVDGGTPRS